MKPTRQELEKEKTYWFVAWIGAMLTILFFAILLFSQVHQNTQLQSQFNETQIQLSLFQNGKFTCHNFSINQEGIVKDVYGNCLYDCYPANIHVNLTRCEVLN